MPNRPRSLDQALTRSGTKIRMLWRKHRHAAGAGKHPAAAATWLAKMSPARAPFLRPRSYGEQPGRR